MIPRKLNHWLLLGIPAAFALVAGVMPRADPAATTPTEATPAPNTHQSPVTFDAGATRWLNAPRTVEMTQGVTLNQDDEFLNTDSAVVNLDDQGHALNAKALAPVHLYDTQDDLTGDHGFIDFTKHVATVNGSIVLTVKPAKKDADAPAGSVRAKFKEPATLTCDMMIYDYRHKIGHVPGPLTVHQKDRTLTADSGEYDAKAQSITLVGHVHGIDSTGNVIQASRAVFGLKEGDESVDVPVPTYGVFPVQDDDEDDDQGNTNKKPGAKDKKGTKPAVPGASAAPVTVAPATPATPDATTAPVAPQAPAAGATSTAPSAQTPASAAGH